MRIGFDLRSLQTGSQYRGIGFYTFNLVRALCGIDSANEYVFFVNEKREGESFPMLDKLVSETGKRVVRLPTTRVSGPAWRRRWEELSTPLFLDLERLDVLHVTSLFESELAIGFSPGRARLVVTLYDLIPVIFREHYLDNAPEEVRNEYAACLELVRKNADGVVTISECTRRDAVRLLGLSNDKTIVAYGGVNESVFHRTGDDGQIREIKDRFGVMEDFILYIAAEDFRKNLDTVLKSFAILQKEYGQRCQLVLAGRSSAPWQERLKDRTRSLGIREGSVVLTGFITDESLNLLYNAASLFVFPSLYEGFGLPILEAMSCGTPVVAANNSSLTEVCGDAAAMVDALDERDMAGKMNEIMSSPGLRESLRNKGFLNVGRFRWESAAEELLRFYEGFSA